MAASNPKLWDSVKTSRRLNHDGEIAPISVQIAGADPAMMAEAAAFNAARGAKIIDINMGCPVKKVCNVASGSALLRHEDLIVRILDAVVAACAPLGVPVTLKTRTGWDRESRNALRVARLADAGIAALTLHGRTRADLYTGHAEYDTIRGPRGAEIPLIANGDIDSPEKAKHVLDYTGADAVMIGRAAQGRPGSSAKSTTTCARAKTRPALLWEMRELLLEHLDDHYRFYGEHTGVRTARKHIGWYLEGLPDADSFRDRMNLIDNTRDQWRAVSEWFLALSNDGDRNPAPAVQALLAA